MNKRQGLSGIHLEELEGLNKLCVSKGVDKICTKDDKARSQLFEDYTKTAGWIRQQILLCVNDRIPLKFIMGASGIDPDTIMDLAAYAAEERERKKWREKQ